MDFDFATNRVQETHFHQNVEILYLLSGMLSVRLDEEEYQLKKGDILLINANKRHSAKAESDDIFVARFQINYAMLMEQLGTNQILFWCNTIEDKNEAYDDLRQVLDKILNRFYERNEGALYLNSLYYEALYIMTSYFMVKADDARLKMIGLQDGTRVLEIQNYVQSNYQKQISLHDLAKQLFLSNAYLSKYIKKRFGLSFMEYLNNVRLFHAVDELLYTDKKIIHIALDNGFPTTSAFNKAFKESYNMIPSAYRVKAKQESKSKEEKPKSDEEIKKRLKEYLLGNQTMPFYQKARQTDLFVVDATNKTSLTSPWGKVINIGEAAMLLRFDIQEHILTMQRELGFTYVRIWNIFIASMYNEKGISGKIYNFSKLDRILDFLVEHKLHPFIDLAFKPMQLVNSTDSILVQNEHQILFQSKEEYKEALRELTAHLVNRYGMEEVESWYFELWEDPRMNIEDVNSIYYENFELGYLALKKVSSKIKVGGAGFILGYENQKYKKVIKNWRRRSIRPDFLSVYGYRYVTMEQDGIIYGKKSLDSSFIRNQVQIMQKVLKEEKFPIDEIYVTEWNFTISNRNCINDSCAQAAYIIKNCIEAEGEIPLMAYWHGTDLHSEFFDTESIINGDSGLLTRDGIKKPSFYAFQFLHLLQNQLLGKNESSILTTNGRGNYTIVCHNSKNLTYRYAVKEENKIQIEEQNELFDDLEPTQLNFQINQVENGDYLVKIHYINQEIGSVQDTWKDMEYIPNLSKSEIDYLKRSSMPHIEMKRIQVEDNTLRIETRLQPHEIRILSIVYQF